MVLQVNLLSLALSDGSCAVADALSNDDGHDERYPYAYSSDDDSFRCVGSLFQP